MSLQLQPCSKNGLSGWQWGKNGTCYTCTNARKLASLEGEKDGIKKTIIDKIKEFLCL